MRLPLAASRPPPPVQWGLAQKRLHTPAGKLVGLFVLDVAGVALDPMPGDLVARLGRIEALPQLDVLYRLLVGRLPPCRFQPSIQVLMPFART